LSTQAQTGLSPLHGSADPNRQALAFLRVTVGLLFFVFGEYKVFGTGFTLHGGFQFWINRFLEGGAYPFMVAVLRGFVLPHATPIAFLVAYGEFAIGLGLILGLLVRPASVCGILYMLTLLFSSDYPGAQAPFWQYFGASLSHSVFVLCFATFLIGRSDEVWSLGGLARGLALAKNQRGPTLEISSKSAESAAQHRPPPRSQ
jgi:thiosulfate dehydrogenase [quinone] large subunit